MVPSLHEHQLIVIFAHKLCNFSVDLFQLPWFESFLVPDVEVFGKSAVVVLVAKLSEGQNAGDLFGIIVQSGP